MSLSGNQSFINFDKSKIHIMRSKYFILIILSTLFFGCSKPDNNPEFIKKTTGRYLFNSDAIIEVYFEKSDLYLKWHGADRIKPMKLKDDTFFVKEMNEKIQFVTNPDDHILYISLIPKDKDSSKVYNYRKLMTDENIPGYFLNNKEYDKALHGYLAIQQMDSLDISIKESNFNSKGYDELRNNKFEDAIHIFKINVALYPNSSNVYDSLGEAYMKKGDTIQAIKNYEKSLSLDSGNKRAKRQIKKLKRKE